MCRRRRKHLRVLSSLLTRHHVERNQLCRVNVGLLLLVAILGLAGATRALLLLLSVAVLGSSLLLGLGLSLRRATPLPRLLLLSDLLLTTGGRSLLRGISLRLVLGGALLRESDTHLTRLLALAHCLPS